jgi:hypothetical protein
MVFGTEVRALVLVALPCLAALAQEGKDIDSAIRIVLGQTIQDIVDSALRPRFVYMIGLARGQEVTVTASPRNEQHVFFMSLDLLGPGSRSLADSRNLAQGSRTAGTVKITYTVATGGDYFVSLGIGTPGVAFTLTTQARGIPVDAPPPAIKECVTGDVATLTYSLLSASINLIDEAEIGTARMCSTCSFKVPLYPNFVDKLYTAYQLQAPVEVCFDDGGQLVRLKLQKPPAVVR